MNWPYVYVSALAGLCLLGAMFWVWLDWKLYRSDFLLALRRSIWSALQGQALGLAVLLAFLLAATIFVEWLRPFPAILLVLGAAGGLGIAYRAVRPPAAIVLGSSAAKEVRDIATVVRDAAGGYRVAYFLRPHHAVKDVEHSIAGVAEHSSEIMDNCYVLDSYMWKYVVYPLLRLVPVIAVVAQSSSSGLQEEFVFLSRNPELCRRVIVYTNSSEEHYRTAYGIQFDIVSSAPGLRMAVSLALRSHARRASNLQDRIGRGENI